MNTAPAAQRNDMTMQQAANELGVCRNGLFALLRDENVLAKDIAGCSKNTPFDDYIKRGLFKVEFVPTPPFNKLKPKTYVTPTGLAFIQSLLHANPEKAARICRRNRPTQHKSRAQQRPERRATAPTGAHKKAC